MKTYIKYIIGLVIMVLAVSTTVLLTLRFVEKDAEHQKTSSVDKKIKTLKSVSQSTKSIEEQFLPIAKESILKVLNDPFSAQFRNYKKDAFSFCLEVNAKNKIGGYVGYRWFSVSMFYNSLDGKGVDYYPDNYSPSKELVVSEVSETSTQCKQ